MPATMIDEAELAEMIRVSEIQHFTAHEFLQGRRMPSAFGPAAIRVLKIADIVRRFVGQPLMLTSGYRPAETNSHVGGASNSSHLYGAAVDLRASARAPKPDTNERLRLGSALAWIAYPDEVGGAGLYFGNTHLDVRLKNKPRRAWWTHTVKAPAKPPKSALDRADWMVGCVNSISQIDAAEMLAPFVG